MRTTPLAGPLQLRALILVLAVALSATPAFAQAQGNTSPASDTLPWPPVATFSILGYDPDTGEIGAAVQSRVFSVGNGVLWAKAGVGVVATQAIVDVSYGPQALELLELGYAPEVVRIGNPPGSVPEDRNVAGCVRASQAGSWCRGRGASRGYSERVASDGAPGRRDAPWGSTCAGGGRATDLVGLRRSRSRRLRAGSDRRGRVRGSRGSAGSPDPRVRADRPPAARFAAAPGPD